MDALPLALEDELHKDMVSNLVTQARAPGLQGRWLAPYELWLPCWPGGPVQVLLECHKERIVVKPGGLGLTKGLHLAAQVAHGTGESPVGRREQASLAANHLSIANAAIAWGRRGFQLIPGKQTLLGERNRIDKQRIAGKSGEWLIGRVSIARWAQRQDLPCCLPGHGGKVNKLTGPLAQVADAVGAREGGGVAEYSTAAYACGPRIHLQAASLRLE